MVWLFKQMICPTMAGQMSSISKSILGIFFINLKMQNDRIVNTFSNGAGAGLPTSA